MENLSTEIREVVKKLFEEEKVELVIGFENGSLPMKATPCFIRSADDIDRLVWNSRCENNLAVYLTKNKGKIGIVAKGCDSRAIVGLMQENQIDRDNLVIIGIPCRGMVDRIKIEAAIKGKEPLEVEENQDTIIVKGNGFEETFTISDILYDNCMTCTHRNPIIQDVLIGEPVEEQTDVDEFAVVKAMEEKSSEERWEHFVEQGEKCVRCYACRNACPFCFCEECSVDSTQPQWFGKSVALSDTQVFHLMRSFHIAGRCVDCGACVRACPMDVDLRFFNKKIEKDVRDLFSHEAGIDPEAAPPLNTYNTDDYDEFIKS